MFSLCVAVGRLIFIALAPLLVASLAYGQQTPREPLVKDFHTLDADGDGYITRAEAEDENVWYHIDAIDKNKDQVVSREEFINYIAEEKPLLGEELPTEELSQPYLRERTGPNGAGVVVTNPELLPKINTDFDSLDDNGDRHLVRDEVRNQAVHEHFSHIDDDSDGRISESEFNSYLYEYGTQVATEEVVEKNMRAP
ncbi:MAG: EF-hand domain-containing protein [Cellvibrionaceae bacterium]